MNKLGDLYSFFNDLRISSGAIWVENGNLKLSTNQSFQNNKTKDFVLSNKSSLISLLTQNHIFAKEDFNKKLIFTDTTITQYSLSPAQERLWFIEQYEEGTNAYHIPDVHELDIDSDKEGIKYALQQIVSRHEVLRTTIDHGNISGIGVQKIHSEPLIIDEVTVNDNEGYELLLKQDINTPFDLSREYPIRAKFYLIKSLDNDSVSKSFLLINTHHIASDGWSNDIFHRELSAYYNAYISSDQSFKLPALEIQYKDYAMWQRSYLTGEVIQKQLNYWRNKLSDYQSLEFPTDYARPAQTDYKGAYLDFTINHDTSNKLRVLAQNYGVTLHSLLLSSIQILMSKYTGQDDILIGSPTANRHHLQTEDLIGFFVNLQTNRTILSKFQSYKDLVLQTYNDQIEAQSYQDIPFEKLVDELGVKRDSSRHPLFQIVFGVQNFGEQNNKLGEKKFMTPYKTEDNYEISRFDLTILVDDSKENLGFYVNYATSLFKKETIERLFKHFENLLIQLTVNPDKCYSEMSLLDSTEFDQIINEWNDTDKVDPKERTIIDLFEEIIVKAPDNIALVFENTQVTYSELDEQSDLIAGYLHKTYNVQSNDIIGIMLDRSEKVIIAILGILKAGASYVFIDPEYPEARKEFIFKDTSLKTLITQTDYIFDLAFFNGNFLAVDNQFDSIESNMQAPEITISPSNLAYVIYTSGTSGKPKGVMVEHKGLVNLVQSQNLRFEIKVGDKVILFSSFVFDASVWEIFTALAAGAQLFVLPNKIKQDVVLFSKFLEDHQINIATLPPILLGTIPQRNFESLKTLIVAGDVCPVKEMIKWSKGRRLINAYGPTESTVCATINVYREGDLNTNIGKSLNNTRLYILDPNYNPVPVGVIGELYIGGASLSRGYLNNSELTDERFVKNIFSTTEDKIKGYTKLYKTGDLVRWLTDGSIEYIGRNDNQVKIRGHRIELGEIEHALTQIDGIKQACVLTKERKTEVGINKYLVGYYVPNRNSLEGRVNYIRQIYQDKIKAYNLIYKVQDNSINAFAFGRSELEFLYKEVFESGAYLENISVKEGDCIFDVGANIGMASIYFAKQAKNIRVYSFEPIDKLYDVLNMNLFIHTHEVEFKTFNYGIGKKNEDDVSFTFFNNNTAMSGQYANKKEDSKVLSTYLDNIGQTDKSEELANFIIESQEIIACRIRTLSTVILEEKIKQIDLLKIDVEKAELDVLNGIEDEDWNKIRQIIIEVHNTENRLEIIKSILVAKGYAVKILEEAELKNTGLYVITATRIEDENNIEESIHEMILQDNIIHEISEKFKRYETTEYLMSPLDLSTSLESILPEYMVPKVFVELKSFPITINGKLDKRALPDPEFNSPVEIQVDPITDLEIEACKIWEQVLGLKKIGVSDNFFGVGGNSILAIQVSHQMSICLKCDIKVADIFKLKTIRALLENTITKDTELENIEKEF